MSLPRRNIATRKSTTQKPDVILLLEDDAHYLDIMAATLAAFEERFSILQAQTLAEAHRLIEGKTVRVFVIDVQLPDGTGLDFFQSVAGQYPRAGSIIVTGTSLIANDNFAERFGIDKLIRKPFRLAELREAVAELIERSEASEPEEDVDTSSEADSDETGNFVGVLKKLSTTDIIQLKCISSASTVITLQSDTGESGKIHILKGQIVHAETGELTGLAALERIVLWDSGKVSESLSQENVPKTIQGTWDVLLMEALRKKDENADNGTQVGSGSRPT